MFFISRRLQVTDRVGGLLTTNVLYMFDPYRAGGLFKTHVCVPIAPSPHRPIAPSPLRPVVLYMFDPYRVGSMFLILKS